MKKYKIMGINPLDAYNHYKEELLGAVVEETSEGSLREHRDVSEDLNGTYTGSCRLLPPLPEFLEVENTLLIHSFGLMELEGTIEDERERISKLILDAVDEMNILMGEATEDLGMAVDLYMIDGHLYDILSVSNLSHTVGKTKKVYYEEVY